MITNQEAIRQLDEVITQYEEIAAKPRVAPSAAKVEEIYMRHVLILFFWPGSLCHAGPA